jgi:anaerobic selenocysteine-containing dehydrogenase
VGPYGDKFDESNEGLNLERLKAAPQGFDLGPLSPRLPETINNEAKRIVLAPEHILEDLPRLREALEARSRDEGMLLVGRRQVRNMNSWLHNLPHLARGKNRCTLLISNKDADRLGIGDGGKARVRSRVGEVEVECQVSDEMMPGVVSLPHGYGHTLRGIQMSVAQSKQPGVNSNILTDEVPLDVPSGTHVANGIPVEVEAA